MYAYLWNSFALAVRGFVPLATPCSLEPSSVRALFSGAMHCCSGAAAVIALSNINDGAAAVVSSSYPLILGHDEIL